MALLDKTAIDFECPHCGEQIHETIGRLKGDGNACPGCGASFKTDEFRRSLDEVEKSLAKLAKTVNVKLKF